MYCSREDLEWRYTGCGPWGAGRDGRIAISKWTRARDKRLEHLISYIHFTSGYTQYCHVGNTAQQCQLSLFQDPDFAGDLEDSKSMSGGTLCVFGSNKFAPISWMCKKQTCVTHGSAESGTIFLDAGLRMDGIPTLDVWDLVIEVLQPDSNRKQKLKHDRGDLSSSKASENRMSSQFTRQVSQRHRELSHVDFLP